MKKKQYIIPQMEVKVFSTMLLSLTGPASTLSGPGTQQAPSRKVPALGNDSVQVF